MTIFEYLFWTEIPFFLSESTSFLLFALAGMTLGGWYVVKRAQQRNKVRMYLNMAYPSLATGMKKGKAKKGWALPERAANLLVCSGMLGREGTLAVLILFSLAGGWLAGYILTGTQKLANLFTIFGPVLVWQGLLYLAGKNSWVIYRQCGELAKHMANAVQAGMTPERAFASVSGRLEEPLRFYMEDAARRVTLGEGLVEALKDKLPYINNTPYNLFVRATVIGKKRGGDMGEAYADIHGIVQKSNNAMEKLKVVHTAGKRRGLILTGIPIGLIILMRLFAPDYAEPLFTTRAGYVVLAVVTALIAAAWLMISQITKVGEL